MIRIVLNLNNKPAVVLGLEPENLDRLTKGEPIKVNLRNLDPDGPPTDLPDIDIMIGATDTDDWRAFAVAMKTMGLQP